MRNCPAVGILSFFFFFFCLLAVPGKVESQHLFLAGGGLKADSDFFWNKLVQLGVSERT